MYLRLWVWPAPQKLVQSVLSNVRLIVFVAMGSYLHGKFRRRKIPLCLVLAVFIIIEPPSTDDFLGMIKVPEPVFVQAPISEFSVEALDISVLHRLSRLYQF